MQEAIQVLHFADTHIGMENYGRTDPKTGLSTRVVDFLRRMEEMIEYARENDVDLVIFAGDAFKSRSPNPTYQREFAWRILELSELAPVVMLVGNHDLAPTVLKASSIEIYDTLAVPNIWVADKYETRVIETKRGEVVVGTAPYPIRSRLMQNIDTRGMTIAKIDAHLQTQLESILQQLAQEADEKAESEDTPRLLTGHFTVSGAVWGSERSVMLGRDIQVSLSSLADSRWDYVALGHIHKHQNLTKKRKSAPPVVYSGSIERVDFGEEGDVKGFCWVDLLREDTSFTFQPLTTRPMVTLRCDIRKSRNPTEKVLRQIEKHNLQGAVVRLLLEATAEIEAYLNETEVKEALKRAGTFHIANIQKRVEQPHRARLMGSPEELSHEELLEQYFISKEVDEERRSELMQLARTILYDES